MRNFTASFIFLFVLLLVPPEARAVVDPLAVPNNRFGIHIFDESDIPLAAELVNSSGGQWGYVTLVVREDERDHARWQRAFDEMRRQRLIPIVRIATGMNEAGWRTPSKAEATNWAAFLDGLNWPTKNRYVILFNEPNHASEWGGSIAPHEYADVVREYANKLREGSDDFFVLPAGLDLAAPNGETTMDAADYFQKMYEYDNQIFTLFDGWTSHSYPNPGFSGRSSATGRTSIRGYQWERDFLSQFGLPTNTPIFITETGWVGENLSENYRDAYDNAWSDTHIVAVTPFILNYQTSPFNQFSWINPVSGEPNEHFYTAQSFLKIEGKPVQIERFTISETFPTTLIFNSTYDALIKLKNTGQSIWTDEYKLHIVSDIPSLNTQVGLTTAAPGQEIELSLPIGTFGVYGNKEVIFSLNKNGQVVSMQSVVVEIVPPPSLVFTVRRWFKQPDEVDGTTITLTATDANSVFFRGIDIREGVGRIGELHNVVPGKTYTVTLSSQDYYEKQQVVNLQKKETRIDFGRLVPKFNYIEVFFHPMSTLFRFLPSRL